MDKKPSKLVQRGYFDDNRIRVKERKRFFVKIMIGNSFSLKVLENKKRRKKSK